MLRFAAALLAGLLSLSESATSQTPVSSVLPSARAVGNGETATVLMTVLNVSPAPAQGCSVQASSSGATMSDLHWTRLINGVPTGTQDAPFGIGPNSRVDLVISSTDSNASYTVGLRVVCNEGTAESPVFTGVNTVSLSFQDNTSDILPIISTLSNDGVIRFNPVTRRAVFAVAAVNIGVERTVRVSGRAIGLPDEPTLQTRICETDANGICLSERTATVDVVLGTTPRFFSVAVTVEEGDGLPFFPQLIRYELQFEDQTNFTRATTTAALYLPLQSFAPVFVNWPDGAYRLSVREEFDHTGSTISPGYLVVGNEEIVASFTQEPMVGPVRQSVDQVVSFDDLSFQRIPVNCGANGSPVAEDCRIRMMGTARALETGSDDAGSFNVRCDFDRDSGVNCDFAPVPTASDLSGPAIDISTYIEALGIGFRQTGAGDIPGGLEGLEVSRFFRDVSGNGESAIVSTGAARSGDQYLPPEMQGRGAIARDVSFTLEGCMITGHIYFFPNPKPDGTQAVAVGGRIAAQSCEPGAAGTAFWGNHDFALRGFIVQVSNGVFAAYTYAYSNAADAGIFASFGLTTP